MAGEREGEGGRSSGRSCYLDIITVEAKEEDEVAVTVAAEAKETNNYPSWR